MKSFFDRLQTVMFVKKMNQDELSSITGIDSGTISRWKSLGLRLYEFDSRSGYQMKSAT